MSFPISGPIRCSDEFRRLAPYRAFPVREADEVSLVVGRAEDEIAYKAEEESEGKRSGRRGAGRRLVREKLRLNCVECGHYGY